MLSITRRIARPCAGVALGIALGLVSRCDYDRRPPDDRRPYVWAADRAGDRVCALDRDLYLLRALEIGAPCEIEVTEEGLLWVLRSLQRRSGAPFELALSGADGSVLSRMVLAGGRELVALGGRRAALIARPANAVAEDELVLAGLGGSSSVLLRCSGLVALAARGRHLCLGSASGELSIWRIGKQPRCVRRARSPGPIVDLAPGPHAGSWLVLAGRRDGVRCELRDRRLRPVWVRELALRATSWITEGDAPFAWLAVEARAACLALGPRGSIACLRSDLPLVPAGGGVGWHGGGALFLHSGAILAVDANGRSIPGQGGFQDLSDLSRVPIVHRP